MFAAKGVAVYDADAAVHALYRGRAAPLIEQAFPGTVIDNIVDRKRLSSAVVGNKNALKKLEAIIHPLVRDEEKRFLDIAKKNHARFVLLDIPLLFETQGQNRVDMCVVVSAKSGIQRKRVLARPEMTVEKFEAILSSQMPDSEKRRQAHFVVDTSFGLDAANRQVGSFLRAIAGCC